MSSLPVPRVRLDASPTEPAVGSATLSVRGLTVSFPSSRPGAREVVVNDVSFDVRPNEVLGIVGESGSGKTMTALSLLRLQPATALIAGGTAHFGGVDLLSAPIEELRRIRGAQIGMIFQSPQSSLNPVMKIGAQLARPYRLRFGGGREQAWRRSAELLERVGIGQVERVLRSYPHQLSGGMCQRVMIAMMVTCRPRLLIADEPTTALDVTIQAQIFALLEDVRKQVELAMVLITHDLGVVAETCSRVVVLYRGQVMEYGDVATIFTAPRHPYTRYLLESVLRIDRSMDLAAEERVGERTDAAISAGCPFAGRCPSTMARCWVERPATRTLGDGREVACHLVEAESP